MKQKKPAKPVPPKQVKQQEPELLHKPNIWYAIGVAVVGFLLYANTIGHGYVLDDSGVITNNEFVRQGLKGIPNILRVGMWHFENVNLGYYRPLSAITFAIENQFFPDNPHVSHLDNVLLYALTGFFLCMVMMNLFNQFNPVFSLVLSLLFIAHPIHTEVVANIKSRDEILAFLNLLIAIWLAFKAFQRNSTNIKLLVLSCFFYYLALISKESAMTGIFIIPLVLLFARNFSFVQSLFRTLPFLLMVFFFQMHKFAVLGTMTGEVPHDIVNYPYTDADVSLSTTFLIFFRCIKLILFPHPLTYDYSYNQVPAVWFDSPEAIAGMVLAATLLYFSFKGLFKKSTLAFGVLFFCLTLAPALAFVLFRGGIMAERFLYAPSLGFCIALTYLLAKITRSPIRQEHAGIGKFGKLLAPALLLFGLYSFKTITRNPAWHDNFKLYSTDVLTSTNSCQVHRHYGCELINKGRAETDSLKKLEWFNLGTAQLRTCIGINPNFCDPYFSMGVAYQTININLDSAVYYYNKAIQQSPTYAITYNNLGILYEGLNKHELASYYYNKAVEVNPYFAEGVQNRDSHRKRTGLDVHTMPVMP